MMTAHPAWIRTPLVRAVALVVALTLIAVACGGGTEEPATSGTDVVETAAGETSAEPDPTALPDPTATAVPEPTAIPDPTATAVPTPAPATADDTDANDDAKTDSAATGGGDAALRELAIAELMSGADGEDIDRATAECTVDAVYESVGTYAPTEEQELESIGAAMLCFFSSALSPEVLTEAAIEEGHPRETAECLGIGINAMFSDLDMESDVMSGDEEIELVEGLNSCGAPLGAATGDAAPGIDADLDALWVGCSDGSAQDCLSLSNATSFDEEAAEYRLFALSCGGRVIVEVDCGLWIDGESLIADDGVLAAAPETGSAPPGTDPALDALWESCSLESSTDCDTLYLESPIGSEYEAYGYTCGGRAEGGSVCTSPAEALIPNIDLDDVPDPGSTPPGDDAQLDALWEACSAEDGAACDRLYEDSPFDSVYELYGYTCGGRVAVFDIECGYYFEEQG